MLVHRFTPCNGMTLYLNFNGNGDTADAFCALTSGTIVITAVSAGRAQGTFSRQVECAMGTFGSTFTVTNGSFEVALVAAPN